jgi:predicted O-methyltransferase YrrM
MKMSRSFEAFIRTALPKMEGWCTPDKAISLASRVLAEQPSICVEIGVFGGRSLCAIALALKENGSGKVYGIDPWKASASVAGYGQNDSNCQWWKSIDHEAIYRGCMDWINNLCVKDQVEIIRKTNKEALDEVKALGEIGMLHIDGNHTEESSMFDVENYVPLCAPGAIVWFDDMDWASTNAAQARLSELCTFEILIGTCGMYRKR